MCGDRVPSLERALTLKAISWSDPWLAWIITAALSFVGFGVKRQNAGQADALCSEWHKGHLESNGTIIMIIGSVCSHRCTFHPQIAQYYLYVCVSECNLLWVSACYPCASMCVCVRVHVCMCVTPQLTGFQVPLLQHRQPLGPGTQDSDAAEEKKKGQSQKKKTEIIIFPSSTNMKDQRSILLLHKRKKPSTLFLAKYLFAWAPRTQNCKCPYTCTECILHCDNRNF